MSTARTATLDRPAADAPVALRLDAITTIGPWRRRGLDRAHVLALAETPEAWPPIVVTLDQTTVVDGLHRVAAARELGLLTITAVVFEGSADDAFIEFVRLNTSHGLPLKLAERREAAHRILVRTPSHSDRWVAQVCGLSPKTVGRIRQDLAAGGGEVGSELNGVTRIGRDGRVRPVDPAAIRRRIAEELERTPDASLRSIARLVGASPQTVRSVARHVRDGDATDTSPARERVAPVELAAFARAVVARRARAEVAFGHDPAFRSEEHAEQFATLFDASAVDRDRLLFHVDCIPLSRIYEVADEARRRAESWREFADVLESRVRRRA